ncbi:hypothetical protein QN219_22980 [Sinorhizobium sp. 7-81]|uniref:hypothetical protein n=1 Tax=Sinorhizobium sp. 8-89 TaxID=3049089 RepID=UPI0024C2637E|nr:hypothetical protein [Sinorhizobium sp. 8-89]MDK1492889.1 hypothetical protein [Sinorhizobium sp. 8-89]
MTEIDSGGHARTLRPGPLPKHHLFQEGGLVALPEFSIEIEPLFATFYKAFCIVSTPMLHLSGTPEGPGTRASPDIAPGSNR